MKDRGTSVPLSSTSGLSCWNRFKGLSVELLLGQENPSEFNLTRMLKLALVLIDGKGLAAGHSAVN